MIVAVKTNNKKRNLIKLIAATTVVIMFVSYYFHMSKEYEMQEVKKKQEKLELKKINEKSEKKIKTERIIYREVETAVDLIGQRYVQDVKIVQNRALIVVDPQTNLQALKVRYGSMALIKKDLKNTKIAIDLKYLFESKSNAK
jgi:hypothetical protein